MIRGVKQFPGCEFVLRAREGELLMQKIAHEVFSFDEFRLDVTRGALLQGDTELRLRPKSFDVLHYLIENQGRLIGKDELISHVWQGMAVTDDSLVQCLRDIRRALGDNSQEIIKTVPRRGYIFDRPVDLNGGTAVYTETSGFHLVIEEAIEESAKDVSHVAKPKSLTQKISQHKLLTAAAIAFVLLAAGGASFGLYRYRLRAAVSPFTSVAVKRLTNDGKTKTAAISPDGKYFAFALAEGDGKNSLWVRQISTVNNVPIVAAAKVDFEGLNFSPDSDKLYFVQDGVLYQTGALGGSPRRLWNDVTGRFAISPDGKRIAFTRLGQGDGKGTRLIVVNSDGTGDERMLAYRKPPEAFTTGGCAWSPNGDTLVCAAGDNPSFGQQFPLAVRVLDGEQTPLTSRRWNIVGKSAWVRDGSGFVMTALDNRDGGGQLWYVSYPDGEAVRIQSDPNDYLDITLTADNNALMAIQREPARNVFSVELADITKSSQLTFATSGHNAVGSVTPLSDGSLLYTSDAGGSRDLWIMDAGGGNARQLTNDEAMESNATLSPDGRSIAFAAASDGIWRIDLDGSRRRQLAKNGMFPEFSSDGTWIYYTLPRDRWTLWKVAAEGGDPLRVTEIPGLQPAVSPDGRLIAYVSGKARTDFKLFVCSIESGEPIRIFDATLAQTFDIHWLPDGKSIAYQSQQNGVESIVSQPLDGSSPQVLLTAPPEAEGFSGWGFSADGKRLYYAAGPIHYDVVLFDLGK